MKKKNVLLLVNQLHGGGAQKVIANLSIHLHLHYNITLAIYNDLENIAFDYKGELVKLMLPFSKDTHNNPFHKRFFRSVALIKQVRNLKKERQIDVTISFLESSNIINVLSRTKDKIILSVRSYLSHEFQDLPRLRVFSKFIRVLYRTAYYIVVPANLVKHDLVKNFGINEKKIRLIYNFTDLQSVAKLKEETIPESHEWIFNNGPVIVNIGRMNQPKGQWLQPLVVSRLKKKIPHIKLLILGDGLLREKIIKNAEHEKLKVYDGMDITTGKAIDDEDIILLGFAKNPFPYLKRSIIFLKSSLYEGFPNVIIEAMSCGLPVVSSDCASGPREIISPDSNILSKAKTVDYAEYGVLTPVAGEDVTDEKYADYAAQAIADLLTNEQMMENYKRKSLKRAADFDVKNIISQWIELIDET